jgi:uncharacterized protein (TIGR02099 family)
VSRWLRIIEVLAWCAFFALAAALLALRYWVLPHIERYRGDIVAAISRGVGLEVRVGRVEAGWQGLRPHISLSDVRIYDAAGREALVLPSVENIVSWRSLLARELRLHSLVIDSPRLGIRRDAAGALYVAGMKLSGEGGDGGLTGWLLGQDRVLIRNAEIEWRDEKRGAPPLSLSALNLRLHNSGERHSVGISARPPAALGPSIDLRGEFDGTWSGRVYALLGYTDLAAWRDWIDYPVDLHQGQGALRLWARFDDGRLSEATADVALAQVAARLGNGLAPLELKSVQGRLHARLSPERYEVAGIGLALVAERGPSMPPLDFELAWTPSAAERGSVGARVIELGPLTQLAESLPIPIAARGLLAELEPRGRLTEAKFDWHGALADPQRFTLSAGFSDLAMRGSRGVPGFAGLSGKLEANEARGSVYLLARNAEVDLPRVFPEPRIALEALNGQVDWERDAAGRLQLRLSSITFFNEHLSGSAYGTYTHSGAGPGSIDLSATLLRADGRHAAKYLPLGTIMGQTTRDWLTTALLAGAASDVKLRLRGDLRDFPFRDPAKGEFLVAARIQKGVLQYANGWPRISDIDCELRFERDRMEIAGRSATILGARLANVRASIPSLASDRRVLIAGEAHGPTGEFLKFIDDSPLRRRTGGLTSSLSASGAGQLRLKLELPLANLASSKVAGEYEFADNDLTVHQQLPSIEHAGGKIEFSESAFAVHDMQGTLFGGGVAIAGGSRPGGEVEMLAGGEATIAATSAYFDHPLARHLSGSAPYTASVNMREGLTRVAIESSLRGIGSTLPAPLEKAPGDSLPLRFEMTTNDAGASDRISISLGRIAAVAMARRKQDQAMTLQRTAIVLSPAVGQVVRLQERPGTVIRGSVATLDADRWMPLLPRGDGAAQAAVVDVRIGALDVFGKRVRNLTLKANSGAAGWTASVSADELAGELAFRSEGGGQLRARLAHLTVPADSPGATPRAPRQPADLPGIDFIAERFSYRGRELGRVELAGIRAGDEWLIERIAIDNSDSSFKGRGAWRGGAPSHSTLNFELDTNDSGEFLARAGHPGLVKGGKARLTGSLAWEGNPGGLDYPTLSGDLQLRADTGQFLEIEPGLGKLISLMSLQALPRRIALDFRDVFSKGFRFDRIASSAHVERGVMGLKDFRMRGSSAEVEMSGQVDLALETQSLRVRIVPSLGDSASTAVAIVNPVAGVAAALAQRVLKNPLGQIFAFDYSVSGSWSDPKVAKIGVPPTTDVISP